jgi:hypothetical protein
MITIQAAVQPAPRCRLDGVPLFAGQFVLHLAVQALQTRAVAEQTQEAIPPLTVEPSQRMDGLGHLRGCVVWHVPVGPE